jgi:hypothetical protein
MEPMMKNPVSAPASNGARFAELVDDVRGGDPVAIKKLQHLLGPGCSCSNNGYGAATSIRTIDR